jgi:hypothetical protein
LWSPRGDRGARLIQTEIERFGNVADAIVKPAIGDQRARQHRLQNPAAGQDGADTLYDPAQGACQGYDRQYEQKAALKALVPPQAGPIPAQLARFDDLPEPGHRMGQEPVQPRRIAPGRVEQEGEQQNREQDIGRERGGEHLRSMDMRRARVKWPRKVGRCSKVPDLGRPVLLCHSPRRNAAGRNAGCRREIGT